ncbi:hypothetical protein D9Q98_001694 [Chlorella vulgaris]|uniref:Serine/threonine-protein kinase TOR n=1 Tax=Chlorella vulgaris TaxID=3077 RepID=A0A9D4TVF5_CHLVU|nr:hypothetical protein D9Q98_001694 [Chlorella vulgaris]
MAAVDPLSGLSRCLSALCRPGAAALREEHALASFVDAEGRSTKGDKFNRFLAELHARVRSLVTSPDPYERLAGVLAIDELASTKVFSGSAARLSDLVKALMEVFQATTEVHTMQAAAATLGNLVKAGGALMADVVEEQVRRGIQWLAAPRQEHLRLAGVLLLRELAEHAPAIFNVHVRAFIEVIWNPLRDPRQHVREAAVAALRACLVLVEKRETRYRVQWYYRLFEETQRGLTRVTSLETVHGSLLALGELLRHTGEFMLARYREVCDTVLRFRDSKEKLIRRAVITLLPRLAAFAPQRFVKSYLKQATEYLLGVLGVPPERGAGFTALGEMAGALCRAGVASRMKAPDDFLRPIAAQIKECLGQRSRGRPICPEALECAGTLAVALRRDWQPYMLLLLEPMFQTGLSDALVQAMHKAVGALPELLPRVQALLLDLLSLVLARRPFSAATPSATISALQQALAGGELQGSALTRLALHTLGGFSWTPHHLLDFVRDHVTPYLDDNDGAVRRAAAVAACHVLEQHVQYSRRPGGRLPAAEQRAVDKTVQRLLASAVADPSVNVRRTILEALSRTAALESHLAQAECLRSLFVALNDESSRVRALTIQLAGAISPTNPAYVMPALRRHLMQLLSDMDHSPDSRQREESARLLGVLIRSAPKLVLPYTAPVLRALVSKLRAASSAATPPPAATTAKPNSKSASQEEGFEVAVLMTLGELARVAGTQLRADVPDILPLIIDAIQDGASHTKRLVAVSTLGQVVGSTGFVVVPYLEYPQLLGVLLRMLSEGGPGVRREVIKVLGIIGALDPHTHKVNLAELQGEGRLEREGVRPQFPNKAMPELGTLPGGVGEQALDLLPSAGLVTSSEDYYPTVAINALMRVLREPSAAALHGKAVAALFEIIQAMGLSFVPYLHKVVPVLLQLTRGADDLQRRVDMVRALTDLVVLMRQHVRKFLPDLLALVNDFWGAPGGPAAMLPHILSLLAELSQTLRDDFRFYMPELLPKFVSLLNEAERTNDFSLVKPALDAVRALGPVLEDHLQLLLPALNRLIVPGSSGLPMAVQEETLAAMQDLLPRMQLSGFSSTVLHPLIRLLDGPSEELRERALDTLCSVALAIGPDFAIFVPTMKKIMARHRMPTHSAFARVASKLLLHEPPCMSEAEDWESSSGFLAEEHLAKPRQSTPDRLHLERTLTLQSDDAGLNTRLRVEGVTSLRRAWESSQRSTKEDWAEWMRNFSIELLKQSPSRALRACASLAQTNPSMARELFAAGFVSCWSELDEGMQEQLVRSLEAALASPTIPPDIVTTLLNLAEFMEHDEKALPLDTRTLGALAEKCHAYAKALHYKELEFQSSPHTAVEALISINNQLRQPDAAVGVLNVAQKELHMDLKESWYEKLQRWDDALRAYRVKLEAAPPGSVAHVDALLGQCRCLAALAEWDKLFEVCRGEWVRVEPHVRREMAPIAAHAAWQLGDWRAMRQYVDVVVHGQSAGGAEGAFLSAVISIKNQEYAAAAVAVERARDLLGTDLAALVGESYERAYADMLRVQQLTELEEILAVKREEQAAVEAAAIGGAALATVGYLPMSGASGKVLMQSMWNGRLKGVQRNVEVWQALLSVRRLMLDMHEDSATWLKYASLCRKSGRISQSEQTLVRLLNDVRADADVRGLAPMAPGSCQPDVMFSWYKHLWATGAKQEAFAGIQHLSQELTAAAVALAATATPSTPGGSVPGGGLVGSGGSGFLGGSGTLSSLVLGVLPHDPTRQLLSAKVHLKLGLWRRNLTDDLTEGSIAAILTNLRAATECAPAWGKAWHHWAYFNCEAMVFYGRADAAAAQCFVAPAVTGFFRSIELGQTAVNPHDVGTSAAANLQDILRLLTLWFSYGAAPDVEAALVDGFGHVSIETWLVVIPQVIARIHTSSVPVRRLIHSLLVRIGRHHPQALMYPLLVACKSQSPSRRAAAMAVVDAVRQHSATLVEQAQLVSQELIRMAILWHEMWHEALEEASRLYFGESNVEGMLSTLLPLHEMMRKQGPTTLKEIAFVQAYGRELDEAHEWCLKYKLSRKEAELHQAWDLYYHVFKRINKQLPSLTTLELQYVAPALVRAQGLELAVPGTYIAGEPLVTIAAFAPQLHVITSKQRPRKLAIHGSDGAEYMFLLKGHEDLRQDERVMQLFGLVNNMLSTDRVTAERDLSIARYAVIPLSPNSGLIGWVPNTDTLHALIREYRDARKIPLNVEHRLMLGMAPDYDHLTVIQKVEVFEHAMDSTSGEDLHKVLWLKSRNSEVWLERRTHYTRSTAVMSMVGYILGLGDRHPSNLMLDRYSGKLLHIDFGDCFEASMNRDKFPEKVPFRLTRMMVKAMEVSGIEGNFRATCNEVMRVLRGNKDSVMAMLEAFVHDPLINWRLLNTGDNLPDTPVVAVVPTPHAAPDAATAPSTGVAATGAAEGGETLGPAPAAAAVVAAASVGPVDLRTGPPSPPRRELTRDQVLAAYGGIGDANEVLNERAVAVMRRMSDKLTGRDAVAEGMAAPSDPDSVPQQVQRLIALATSNEALCQSYIGWCPFW